MLFQVSSLKQHLPQMGEAKLIMKNLFLSALFLSIFSCTDDKIDVVLESSKDDINKSESMRISSRATLAEKSQYKEFHLKRLATWYHLHKNNAAILNHIASVREVDGEKLIVINDLIIAVYGTELPERDVAESLSAFLDLDGQDWTPTLTFLNVDVANNYPFKPNADEMYFFPSLEIPTPQTTVPAWFFPPFTFELILFDLNFTALNALNYTNLVFDITISTGLLANTYTQPNTTQGVSGPNHILINKLTIKNLKEDWVNGKADVHVVGFTSSTTPAISGICGAALSGAGNCFNYDGARIDQIKRAYENHEHQHDYLLQNYSLGIPFDGGDVLNYVIFESDSWPANLETKTFPFPNGQIRNISYRSGQTPFHDGQVMRTQNGPFPFTGTYVQDNSDIKYNLLGGL